MLVIILNKKIYYECLPDCIMFIIMDGSIFSRSFNKTLACPL